MNALLIQKGGNPKANYVFQTVYSRYLRRNFRTISAVNFRDCNRNENIEWHAQILQQTKPSTASITPILHKPLHYHYRYLVNNGNRYFHSTHGLYESTSKIDATVKKLKNQQKEKVEEIMKEVANGQTPNVTETAVAAASSTVSDVDGKAVSPSATQTAVADPAKKSIVKTKPKKPLQQRIWEELVHYYHGFRLLSIDTVISTKLLWRVLNGKTLTRRENKQLQRTISDLFRLIPFSVFIVVPFMELLLPLFIKFFPGMLPSTFQTSKDRQERLRQSLGVRLEVAKFLQQTLGQMPVQHKEHSSEEAKQFETFFQKIRDPNEYVSNDEIIKFAKRFDDEITLDSLSREQLAALCRVLELNTIGTTTLLRFQLRLKLRSLATDDRVIAREGVDSLDLFELQQACKSRGMRAYGLTAERLRSQLKEWIDLSLNEQVPPTLLLLSRAMLISDDSITTDKLKETMRVLPDAVAAHTRHAIGEREGKVDNKTKIEIIKEEERKIKEEREEEHEETIAKRTAINDEVPPPYICTEILSKPHLIDSVVDSASADHKKEKTISTTDVQLLSDALKTLSSDKQLMVEKETIKELKEELRDYKEDVEELHEVRQVVKEPIRESRAAKLLYNRVNKMIGHLDKVLNDLEHRQQQIKRIDTSEYIATPVPDVVHIEELVSTIRRMKESSDEERFKVVEDLMIKLDADNDGAISVNEITKLVQKIDSEATKIDKKQLEEFTELLSKQATKRRNEELVRIDDLMQNIKTLKETSDEARLKHIESVLDKFDADKDGVVTVNDIRKVLESIGRDNVKLNEKAIEELIMLLDKEQILQAEQKIEKAIAKSIKEAEKLKAEMDKTEKDMSKLVDDIKDSAKEINDIATQLGAMANSASKDGAVELQDKAKNLASEPAQKDKAKVLKDGAKELDDFANQKKCPKVDTSMDQQSVSKSENKCPKIPMDVCKPLSSVNGDGTEAANRVAAERQVDKLLPQNDINMPTIPTIPSTTTTKPPSPKKATATASTIGVSKVDAKKLL